MVFRRLLISLARLLAVLSTLVGPGAGAGDAARDAVRGSVVALRGAVPTLTTAARVGPLVASALFAAANEQPLPAEAAATTTRPLGWGNNYSGQLGQGTSANDGQDYVDYVTPQQVTGLGGADYLDNITAVAGGNNWTLALRNDGTVWAWGYNGLGQLGNGTTTGSTTPIQVQNADGTGFLTGVKAIAAGGSGGHNLALLNDGTVWAWGGNSNGQLGPGANGTCGGYACSARPVQVTGLPPNMQSIAAGGWHSLAVAQDGTVWAWGWNVYGQLGNCTSTGYNTSSPTPGQVHGYDLVSHNCLDVITGATMVAGGASHSLARLSNGSVVAWGYGGDYELGDGQFHGQVDGAIYAAISGAAGVAAGYSHSLAWTSDNRAFAWGDNSRGELGQPSSSDCPAPGFTPTCIKAPSQITALGTSVARVTSQSGASHTVVLETNGSVWAFGWNSHGQLGNNSTTDSQTPVQANALTGATDVAAGTYFSLALGTGAVRQTTPSGTTDLNAPYADSGGDPVQTSSGAFTYRHTDVAIPGRGPSPTFTRFYNSSDTAVGALGQGWTHNYATRLLDPGDGTGALVLLTPEGRRDRYTRNQDGTYAPPPASATTLIKNGDGTFTVTNPGQSVWSFGADGRLTRVADRYGNASTLTYNVAGQLTSVSDPAGRGSLTFAYDGTTGRMTSVTDWYIGTPRVVQFGYDSTKRLQTVTDREGKVTTYGYECCWMVRHLTTITDADNHIAIQNAYDNASGHVTAQKDARGQTTGKTTTFSYVANGDGSKTTTVTYPPASLDGSFNPQQVDTYDPQGRLTQRVWKPSSTETYTTSSGYDANFFTTSATDARGNTTTFCYDTDYAGAVVAGSRGNLTRKIAPAPAAGQNPVVTLFKYDTKNNLVETVPPKGVGNGATVTCATDLSGVVNTAYATDYAYDGSATKLLSVTRRYTDPDLGLQTATTKYEYGDAANPGMVTKVINPRGNTGPNPDYAYATTLAYYTSGTQAGLLQSTADPLGNTTTYAYDEVGRRTSMVDPMGNPPSTEAASSHTWTYIYDKEDRLRFGQSPPSSGSLATHENRYDAVGNRIVAIDGNGQVTKYVYDERDSLKEVHESPSTWTDPNTTPSPEYVTSYQYDDLGALKRVTRAQGTTDERAVDYASDGLRRLRRETQYPAWPTTTPTLVTTVAYDGNGNRLSVVDPLNRTTTFGYDNLDRPTSVTYSDGTTPNVAYQYDADGSRTQMADGTGATTYTVDELGRPTAITAPGSPGSKTVGYRYDLDGNRTKLIYPDATAVTYQFDAADRMTYGQDWQGFNFTYSYRPDGRPSSWTNFNGVTSLYGYDAAQRPTTVSHQWGQTVLASWSYTLDGSGNRTHVDEQLPQVGASPIPTSLTFTYDRLYRLLDVVPHGGCVMPCPPDRTAHYTYDRVGNRLTGSTGGAPAVSYAYDKADRITAAGTASYVVDSAGNTVTAGNATYTYDQANRVLTTPSAGATAQYAYDGEGNRASATVGGTTTRWVYDRAGSLPEVLDDGSRKYVYGLGLAYTVEGYTTRYAPMQDGLGTIRALVDPGGQVVQTYETYAFGEAVQAQGANPQPFQFTGEQKDADTGLYYLRARMYDPRIGRFLSRDTLFGSLGSPLSLNRYSYVENNPVNLVDPSGRSANRVASDDPHRADCSGSDQSLTWLVCPEPSGQLAGGMGSISIPNITRAIADWLKGKLSGDEYVAAGGSGPSSSKVSYLPTSKVNQAARRGWTKSDVNAVVNAPEATATGTNRATGNPATYYYGKDGHYVVRDDITGVIVQLSDRNDPGWIDELTNRPVYPR